jgi:hypothetical protein
MDPVLSQAYSLIQRQTAEKFPHSHPKVSLSFYARVPPPLLLCVLDLLVWPPPFIDTVTYEYNKLLYFHVVDLYIRIYL